MTTTRRYLQWYIRIQAALLCVLLGTLGASLAAQRTRYIADGAPVAAQRESPLPQAVYSLADRLPDMPDADRLLRCLRALPAPLGCVVGTAAVVWELCEQLLRSDFGILHKSREYFR